MVEGEVIDFPNNIALRDVPELMTISPVDGDYDPVKLAVQNAGVADQVLRQVVRRANLTFRFTGDYVERAFVFDGPNPTVVVEPDESVELDGMPVTVALSTGI